MRRASGSQQLRRNDLQWFSSKQGDILNAVEPACGTVFNWSDPDGGGPATAGSNVAMGVAGTLHITDVLTNTSGSPITVTYAVTPTSGAGCVGAAVNVVITVEPGAGDYSGSGEDDLQRSSGEL